MKEWYYPKIGILAFEWPIENVCLWEVLLLKSGMHENEFLNVLKVILLVWNRLNMNNKIGKPNYRFDIVKLVWLIIYTSCTSHVTRNLAHDMNSHGLGGK